jgi:hypothetical protein
MTVVVDEDIRRPPGITSLRQWGQMKLAEGKHRHKTFMEVINEDRDYATWMKKHPKLASDWATSFQNFVKAWDQAHVIQQSAAVGLPIKTSGQVGTSHRPTGWSEDEEELVLIEDDKPKPSPMSVARCKAAAGSGKRSYTMENVNNMNVEADPTVVAQLQLQIALLQDQLAQITKNTEK